MVIANVCAIAQRTVGVQTFDPRYASDGYTLFAPLGSTTTYLIDNCGRKVHSWPSQYVPGLSVYLLQDGSILRMGQYPNPIFMGLGGYGGIVERIAWDGTVLWSYIVSTPMMCAHHDAYPMPNGNVMIISIDRHLKAEADSLGRKNLKASDVWSDMLLEVKPTGPTTGDIVWQWKLWDHLVNDVAPASVDFGAVAKHPELLDINAGLIPAGLPDWIHLNSVDYNADRDEILISSHNLSEIWIIDHSTTTAEAATHRGGKSGKGGDFLYRWGNPQLYGQGDSTDQVFGMQHNAHWIPKGLVDAGKIMVYNNDAQVLMSNAKFSSVDIIDPPVDEQGNYVMTNGRFGPESLSWRYTATPPESIWSSYISGCQRLPNGNTLICHGALGFFSEVTPQKTEVWRYVNPVGGNGPVAQGKVALSNQVFRAPRYAPDYPAFSGRILSSDSTVEIDPNPPACSLVAGVEDATPPIVSNTLHFDQSPSLSGSGFSIATQDGASTIRIIDVEGRVVDEVHAEPSTLQTHFSLPPLPSGMYIAQVMWAGRSYSQSFVYLGGN